MSTHSERILERLNELGWNKTELAEKAAIQPATLSRLLKSDDARLKRAQTMARIGRAMGVRTEWLMTGQEPKLQAYGDGNILEFLEDDGLARLNASVEALAEFIELKGYKFSPSAMATEACKLFTLSIRVNTVDKDVLLKYLTGELKEEIPTKKDDDFKALKYLY